MGTLFYIISVTILLGGISCGAVQTDARNERSVDQVNPTVIRSNNSLCTTYITVSPGVAGPKGEKGDHGRIGTTGRQGPPGPVTQSGGVTFIRWGRTSCPGTAGMQLLYSGRAAGSHFNTKGSGSNHLCLPNNPQFLSYTPGRQEWRARIYGVEYEVWERPPTFSNQIDHDVPCSLCYTSARGAKITIPARYTCPSGWTREYYGYLMADYEGYATTTYECVDVSAESVPGSSGDDDGGLFYFTESTCTSINCPPYENGKELTCVVCTK